MICIECQTPFDTKHPLKQCCSAICQHSRHLKLRRIRERRSDTRTTVCPTCQKSFATCFPQKKYCSTSCYTAETRQSLAQANVERMRLARFVLSFMERRMPDQLEKLRKACEEKQNAKLADTHKNVA